MISLDSPRMRCNANSWRTCTAPTNLTNSLRRAITRPADERNASRWSRAWVAPVRSSAKSSDEIVDLVTRRFIHRGKNHPIDRCIGGVGLLASLCDFCNTLRISWLYSVLALLFVPRWLATCPVGPLFRCWSGWFGFGDQISDLRPWWSSLVSIRGGSSLLRPATCFLLFFFPIWELYTVFLSLIAWSVVCVRWLPALDARMIVSINDFVSALWLSLEFTFDFSICFPVTSSVKQMVAVIYIGDLEMVALAFGVLDICPHIQTKKKGLRRARRWTTFIC